MYPPLFLILSFLSAHRHMASVSLPACRADLRSDQMQTEVMALAKPSEFSQRRQNLSPASFPLTLGFKSKHAPDKDKDHFARLMAAQMPPSRPATMGRGCLVIPLETYENPNTGFFTNASRSSERQENVFNAPEPCGQSASKRVF